MVASAWKTPNSVDTLRFTATITQSSGTFIYIYNDKLKGYICTWILYIFCCSHKVNLYDQCHILWYESNCNKDANVEFVEWHVYKGFGFIL
jgi:hypothetical protein